VCIVASAGIHALLLGSVLGVGVLAPAPHERPVDCAGEIAVAPPDDLLSEPPEPPPPVVPAALSPTRVRIDPTPRPVEIAEPAPENPFQELEPGRLAIPTLDGFARGRVRRATPAFTAGTVPGEAPAVAAAASAPPPPAPPPIESTRAVASEWSPPAYPERARARGVEGEVTVEVEVGADGSVGDVRVVRSSGSALLDRAAERAVRLWRFRPATEGGVAVADVVRLPPIRFELKAAGGRR
jgi:protein TonB